MTELEWYRGKRVFLTGHTGFKGCWLTLWLRALGAEVTGYALPPQPDSMFAATGAERGIESRYADIRDLPALEAAMRAARPQVVLHMAAQALVRPSYADPVGTYATNVLGTVNLLDCARRIDGIAAVVVVTSDKCYENDGATAAFDETAPMGGHDPYSSSKGCAELVTRAYARSYFRDGCAVAAARAGNVIGGGDWAADRIVPDLVRAAMAGEAAIIRNPDARRPWQHVLEPLSAYLLLGRMLAEEGAAAAGGWNIGPRPEESLPVRELAAGLARHWPRIRYELAVRRSGPHEAESLRLDCTRIAAHLGWRPALSIDEALRLTAEWYRQNAEAPGRILEMTLGQIRDYAALRAQVEQRLVS